MIWELLAEERIREAIENGLFDDLTGKGKPLDLTDYFNTPVADRIAFSVLKNAGVIPPEMELLKETDRLERLLHSCRDPQRRSELQQLIQAKRVGYQLAMERRSFREPLANG